jgi:ABC-type metal ion transport system substrate-binding protein
VIPDPALEKVKIDAQSSQTKAILKHELETTAKTLETTSKVYGETQKLLSDQQSNLSEINGTLARFTSGTIKLEESKEI